MDCNQNCFALFQHLSSTNATHFSQWCSLSGYTHAFGILYVLSLFYVLVCILFECSNSTRRNVAYFVLNTPLKPNQPTSQWCSNAFMPSMKKILSAVQSSLFDRGDIFIFLEYISTKLTFQKLNAWKSAKWRPCQWWTFVLVHCCDKAAFHDTTLLGVILWQAQEFYWLT